MSDLNELRTRLEAELEAEVRKHGRLSNHLRNQDRDVPSDWSDKAQFLENDEVLEALEGRARDRIERIATALRRIHNGIYASCSSCGEEIEAERLDVLPTTTICAVCARR